MIEITKRNIVISCCLSIMLIIAVCVNFNLKTEKVQFGSKMVEQVVYADSTTLDGVQADVVFISDGNENSTDSQLDNLESTIQSAISIASNEYIDEQETKLRKEKERQLELQRQEEERRLANAVEVKGSAMLSYNPFVKSNISVEQYNVILKGTGLEGCGQSFYTMEETYGVNGLFAIGVAFHESGYGRAKANTNNFYGMRGNNGWMAFDSPDANIQYFGKLMNKSLYYGKSIVSIGKIYCPGTYESWASAVKSMMKSSFNKI